MMAQLLEDIINEKGLSQIVEQYVLKPKYYLDRKLVVLNYTQRNQTKESPKKSPKNNYVADQCRGIILYESEDGYRVICRPFDRFYNHIDGDVDFDFSTKLRILEKADGSLIKIYYHDGRWEIATRGTAFAECLIHSDMKKKLSISTDTHNLMTYKELVLLSFGLKSDDDRCFQEMMKNQRKDLTYNLECIGPKNEIKTKYEKAEMVFLAARNTQTGEEVKVNGFPNARLPRYYDDDVLLDDAFERKEYFDKLFLYLRDDEEGFVVINEKGARVKVKNPRYFINKKVSSKPIQRARPNYTRIIEAVVSGTPIDEEDEKLRVQLQQSVEKFQAQVNQCCSDFQDMSQEERKKCAWKVYSIFNDIKKKKKESEKQLNSNHMRVIEAVISLRPIHEDNNEVCLQLKKYVQLLRAKVFELFPDFQEMSNEERRKYVLRIYEFFENAMTNELDK